MLRIERELRLCAPRTDGVLETGETFPLLLPVLARYDKVTRDTYSSVCMILFHIMCQ